MRHWFADEKTACNEFCETDGGHNAPALPRRDAQEQISDHGGDDLEANGVFGAAKKTTDDEVLLDPAEQQFDLPAALVECRNLDCRACTDR